MEALKGREEEKKPHWIYLNYIPKRHFTFHSLTKQPRKSILLTLLITESLTLVCFQIAYRVVPTALILKF